MKKLSAQYQQISQECKQTLRIKYNQMSMIQLRKQKINMVKDLQQINSLLDNVIQEELTQQSNSVENLDKQIEKNKKIQRGLRRTLENFQFMLTGDYSVKCTEEITRLRNQLKVMKQEINKFNRMLAVPIQKDIQLCDQLQKQVFHLQKNVQQGRGKIIRKKQRIAEIAQQNKLKIQQFQKINKQIKKLIDSEQHTLSTKVQKQNEQILNYEELMSKKNKLLILIDRDEKRYNIQYKTKLKKFTQIEQASTQIQYFIKQIQYSLIFKNQQLEKVRDKSRIKVIKTKRNTQPMAYIKRKIRTEQNSEIQNIIKQKQKRIQKQIYTVKQSSEYRFESQKDRSTQSNNLLPSLYKAIGKSKLQIQQDYDVKDLIYS